MRSERRVTVVEAAQRVADARGHRLAESLALAVQGSVATPEAGGAAQLVEELRALVLEGSGARGVTAQRRAVELSVDGVEPPPICVFRRSIQDGDGVSGEDGGGLSGRAWD